MDTYKADSSAQQKSIAELEQQKRQLAEDLQVSHSAAATYRCRRTQGQGALARAPAKGACLRPFLQTGPASRAESRPKRPPIPRMRPPLPALTRQRCAATDN